MESVPAQISWKGGKRDGVRGGYLIWVGDPTAKISFSKLGPAHTSYKEIKLFHHLSWICNSCPWMELFSCKLCTSQPPLRRTIWVNCASDLSTHPPSVLLTHCHPPEQTTVASAHYLSTLACYQHCCWYLRPITLDLQLSSLLQLTVNWLTHILSALHPPLCLGHLKRALTQTDVTLH